MSTKHFVEDFLRGLGMVLRVREAITDGLHVLCRRLCIGDTDEEQLRVT